MLETEPTPRRTNRGGGKDSRPEPRPTANQRERTREEKKAWRTR